MGFGTLFFGYFLLLNIAYYGFTDMIAALIMAMALNKLSSVNASFKSGFFVSMAFAAVGLFELVISFMDMFSPSNGYLDLLDYAMIPRTVAIAILTLFILKGIDEVASEVGLSDLARRAKISMTAVLIIYGLETVLNIPIEYSGVILKILSVIAVFVIFSTFVIVTINLITIYRAYMKICMPEDVDNDIPDKPSRFEFINKHREHTKDRQREYAEYRLEKFKKKNSKKKK